MRSESSATCTSGEPVSAGPRRNCARIPPFWQARDCTRPSRPATSCTSMREHQRADLSRQDVAIPELKSLVLPLNLAAAVDQKAGRDARDAELPGERTVRVEDDAKARDVVLKEPLGVGMHVIYIDRDDDKTVRTQRALHAAHPGKRAPAGCAPGCPEIDIHDLAPECGEVEQLVCT